MMTPYPFQAQAIDGTFEKWRSFNRALLVQPTGTGKTVVFSHIAKRLFDSGGKTLILAHRDELIRQACDKLHRATGIMAAVEKAEEHAASSMYPVTVGSVQTLMRAKRLAEWPRDAFQAVIVDEAHHVLGSSYQAVLQHFEPHAKVLGVTATPDRGDRKNLGKYFETLVADPPYDLRKAVQDGFLSRILAKTIPLQIDLDGVKVVAGDYDKDSLSDALTPYLDRIADEIKKEASSRKVLVFLPLRKTSKAFTEILRSKDIAARHVDGESEDREDVIRWLASPGPKVCCNAMLLTEGFDEPSVDCVVVLRATKSRPLYAQMIGRGTRLSPATGKASLLLLDFLWHTSRHDLCHPASLVAEKQEVADQMQELQDKGTAGKAVQMDLLDMARIASDEVVRQRHEALAKALREQERKARNAVDPVHFGVMIGAADLEDYEPTMPWESQPASQPQLVALRNFGIAPEVVKCKGQASQLMGKLIQRRKAGLAMPRAMARLEQFGYGNLSDLSAADAGAILDRIKSEGWSKDRVWSFA